MDLRREPICQECLCAICSNEDAAAKEGSDGVNRRIDSSTCMYILGWQVKEVNCIQNVE